MSYIKSVTDIGFVRDLYYFGARYFMKRIEKYRSIFEQLQILIITIYLKKDLVKK
ncbi:Uncharacterised protein [Streptococcus merionis]|uniref:Uncharacterized protein n=1 Tax=Streptococcus merionis TaxID=400065 RepID=A0A239SS23_9STRE|nr:Uncharacterised protein [Streptococcus merionis]